MSEDQRALDADDLRAEYSPSDLKGGVRGKYLPDHRLVTIQALEPSEDDTLVDDLIASEPDFRALIEKSKASPRLPFPGEPDR